MIIFNNSNYNNKNIIDIDRINNRIFNIELIGKTLDDTNLLEEIKDILEPFLYQEDKCIILINDLLTAFSNNEYSEYKDSVRAVFISLLQGFISSGHEIVIFTDKGSIEPDMQELEEIDGIDLFTDQVLLMNHIINHTS